DQATAICEYFTDHGRQVPKLYLLIHNIDGPGLRSERAQSVLATLASCPNIHVVASVDHIHAPLLWDAVHMALFSWVWHDLTTFQPYTTETSYENSLMVRQGEIGLRGVQYVLSSLTSNAKKIFKILAQHQMESIKAGEKDVGISYQSFFTTCRENFLVS